MVGFKYDCILISPLALIRVQCASFSHRCANIIKLGDTWCDPRGNFQGCTFNALVVWIAIETKQMGVHCCKARPHWWCSYVFTAVSTNFCWCDNWLSGELYMKELKSRTVRVRFLAHSCALNVRIGVMDSGRWREFRWCEFTVIETCHGLAFQHVNMQVCHVLSQHDYMGFWRW